MNEAPIVSTIRPGDTLALPVQLSKPLGGDWPVPAGTTIAAALEDELETENVSGGHIAQSSSTPGADWSTGLVQVLIPSANTAGLTPGTTVHLLLRIGGGGQQFTPAALALVVLPAML